jgi:carbon starvation protein
MGLTAITLAFIIVLVAGYRLYGAFIAGQYRLDDSAVTPAQARNDGVDFVPTKWFYLFGQHFSAIAAAGPIAGPILACIAFGWLPCLLWIAIGVVFIGAVHDFSALIASVRHGSHSIAEIAKKNLGRRAWLALICFIWLALVYVILAFTQITAASFVGKAEELEGLQVAFNKGGAVAASSTLYLGLALVMGLVQRFLRPPMWLVTLIFVPATLGCVHAGTRLDGWLNWPIRTWFMVILGYCFVASMLPMWLLQQPRGYLGGFVLYLALAVGLFGVLAGGFEIQQPMISEKAWQTLNPLSAGALADPLNPLQLTDFVLPFLFVTIACGACSGFHGLICGGTTSKQIEKESHCQRVGYGAMLLEGLVAVIALATVMILTPEQAKGQPPARIYGDGLASFLSLLLGKQAFAFCATFGAMAFSTFVFDTLDISTRLGRYLLQELFDAPSRLAGVFAAGATAGVPLGFLLMTDPLAYRAYWTLFGTSNQLLAGLTLMGITVWLRRNGRPCWYTLVPMLAILTITLWALGIQIFIGVRDAAAGRWMLASAPNDLGQVTRTINPAIVNAGVAIALAGLAGVFIREALRPTSSTLES